MKETNNNKGCEAESNAFIEHNISLKKQVVRAENNVYTYKLWRNYKITHRP